MSPGYLDEWRPRRCGARGGGAWSSPVPQRRQCTTRGEQSGLGEHVCEAATGELDDLLDKHPWLARTLLGEHCWVERFFKGVRSGTTGWHCSEWEAASVHPDVLDRALSMLRTGCVYTRSTFLYRINNNKLVYPFMYRL
jgi:hypothetical protein